MNSYERMSQMLAGEPTDFMLAQPICMTFAARFAGIPYGQYVTDYRKLAEAQIRTAEAFDLDIVTLCSDPAREAVDCGSEVRWFEDQPPAHDPAHPLLKQKADLLKLKPPDPLGGGRMHDRVLGAELLREQVGGQLPILGWIEGPMAEAADLRGMIEIMTDIKDDPAFVTDLFDFILEMEMGFARAQIEAGIDMMGIGDAAASLVGPKEYHAYVFPYEKRMVEGLQAMGCPARVHICGCTNHLLPYMPELRAEMYDIDCLADIRWAAQCLGAQPLILGNIDPVACLMQDTPERVVEAIHDCHEAVGARYVVGPGCEVPPGTPHENLRALVAYARSQRPKAAAVN